MTIQRLTLTRPDDWHLHLRDNEVLADVVAASAKQMQRAVIMPNLRPPVVTAEQALAYRQRILAALPAASSFTPLMTLYLTQTTTPEQIQQAAQQQILACKLYPAGATTNSEAGVTDIVALYPVLAEMQKQGMLLLLHGEVVDANVDVFDREKLFIDRVLQPLQRNFPELKIVFEHLTTKDGVDYVLSASANTAATLTPQHLLYNRNAIFNGGLQPHLYCLPVLKREEHRQALVAAATSGNAKFFLGTDSAPHAVHAKESSCGCAGCYSAPIALELYAQVFEQVGRLDQLEGFASFHGADFYGLARNTQQVTLVKQSWQVPQQLQFGNDIIKPLCAGQQLEWKLLDN